jgi:putative endopeptidase
MRSRKKCIVQLAQTRRFRGRKLVVPPVDKSTGPGNDFYKYANNAWIRSATIPSYTASFGVSEEIETSVRDKLLGIIKQLIAGEPKNKHEAAIRTFFKAGLYARHNDDHMKTFRRHMAEFGCMKTPADFARNLGNLVAAGIPTLLSVSLGRSLTDPDDNVLQISSGYLGLPDPSYYKGEAPGKMATLASYEILMRRLGKLLEYDDLHRIVSMESHVADIFDASESEEPQMMTGAQMARKYGHVPWADFWAGYGLGDGWTKMSFVVQGDSWFLWLNRQFRIMPAADWVIWFRSQMLLYFASFLESPIDRLYFDFFNRRLRGDRETATQEYLLYFIAQSLLMVSLSKVYKSCCLSTAHQVAAQNFVKSIISSATERVETIDWLSAEARKRTKAKIRAMHLSVAEVDDGAHYKLPQLSEIDMIFNVIALGKANTARSIHYMRFPKLELPVMDPVFEVNAHYYNSGNRLVIPGGITLWPFFSEADGHLGWSYGGLGAVVGHEMLHGFDEEGKNFDERGVFGPWWRSSDLAAYSKKTKALIRLFSSTEFLGHPLNGKATLSENIADLSGLAISLDALKRRLHGMPDEKRRACYRNFFHAYATSWRVKERRQKSLFRLFTDVHSPAPIRVNKVVAHFQEWYDAFEVKPGDALYIDPKDRIAIF